MGEGREACWGDVVEGIVEVDFVLVSKNGLLVGRDGVSFEESPEDSRICLWV